jgi:hypothetical protein
VQQFIAKHQDQIVGVLPGFDRLVMRGTLRSIAYGQGMSQYLWASQVLLKDFGAHVEQVSERLKAASLAEVVAAGRPVRYLASSAVSKEKIARRIAAEDGITSGPVCVLTCVEPCRSFQIYLQPRHPAPEAPTARSHMPVPVSLRRSSGLWFSERPDTNLVPLLNSDLSEWARVVCPPDGCGRSGLPARRQLLSLDRRLADGATADGPATESRVAIDAGRHRSDLEPDPRRDLRGSSNALLVDLSKRVGDRHQLPHTRTVAAAVPAPAAARHHHLRQHRRHALPGSAHASHRTATEAIHRRVVSDLRQRQEGVRIKHRLNDNSVKLYDKAFTELVCLMRAEATFNSVKDFRVYRPKEGDPEGELAWRPLRRGIADLHRRAEVSRKATERYLDALASVDEDTTLDEVLHRLGQPTYWHGRRVRALQPFAPDDRQLIQAISRGEFTINGVRNRDLQRLSFAQPATTPAEARRRSTWVSRKLRLLRAHGLIYKVTGTHRYHLTKAGRIATTAILTALRSSVRQLTAAAA